MSEKYNARIVNINSKEDAEKELLSIGADEAGIAILREKAVFRTVRVNDVPLKAAILLKQTFISKGGDAAVSRGVAGLTAEKSDVLMMGTLKQYRQALAVMRAQPFGLKEIAASLEDVLFN